MRHARSAGIRRRWLSFSDSSQEAKFIPMGGGRGGKGAIGVPGCICCPSVALIVRRLSLQPFTLAPPPQKLLTHWSSLSVGHSKLLLSFIASLSPTLFLSFSRFFFFSPSSQVVVPSFALQNHTQAFRLPPFWFGRRLLHRKGNQQ